MADLEKLAIQRDRGYLVRLISLLVVGVLVSLFLFGWLTGTGTKGCVSETVSGGGAQPPAESPRK
jgi:hypothetical protein